MSNNQWVQQGTPRDADDWANAQDDYGIPVEPVEWDDYSSEQRMPVPERPTHAEFGQEDAVPEEPSDDRPAQASEPAAETVLPEPEPEPEPEPVTDEAPGIDDGEAPEPDMVEGVDVAEAASVVRETPVTQAVEAPGEAPQPEQTPADAVEASKQDQQSPEQAEFEPAGEIEQEGEIEQAAESAEPQDTELPGDGAEPSDAESEAPEAEPEPMAASAAAEAALTETQPHSLDADTFGRPAEPGATELPEEAGGAEVATMPGLYREDADRTQVIDTQGALAAEAAEEARIAEQLRQEKEARDQRLGLVATSDANELRAPLPPRPGVGRFASFGLLVLRFVIAGVLGVAAVQVLTSINETADYLGNTLIPYPREVAWGLGFTMAAMAVMLVLGLGVRAAGFLLTALSVGALVFLRWGPFPIFVDGMEGFRGDKDLILAAIGILLFCIGGGRAGIDGAISKARWNARISKHS